MKNLVDFHPENNGNKRKIWLLIFIGILGAYLGFSYQGHSQTPGQIYLPADATGRAIMDPNGDGFVSKDRLGFVSNADGAGKMELSMIRVPYFTRDPQGDLATGSSGSQLDFIGSSDDNGTVYVISRTVGGVEYLMVRLRLGANASAGKAWGLLIDTNSDISFSGRNPGYEKEVLLVTGSGGGVQVNSLTPGTTTVTASPRLTPLDTYHQRALAGNGNVFYDYYVPITSLGITTSTLLRFVAVTVTNGTSAISGTVADVSGVDDRTYGNNTATMLKVLGQASPLVSLTNLGGLEGTQTTVAPTVNGPISTAATTITGTSVEASGTTITVYRNGNSLGTTTVGASNTWSYSLGGTTLSLGDLITAKATASGKSISEISNTVEVTRAQSCYVAPPAITAASNSGNINVTVTWTWPSGVTPTTTGDDAAIVSVYEQTAIGTFTLRGTATAMGTNGTLLYPVGGSGNLSGTFVATITFRTCTSQYSNTVVFDRSSIVTTGETTAPTVVTDPILASTGNRDIVVKNNHSASATLILYVNGAERARNTGVAAGANSTFSITGLIDGERVNARAQGQVSTDRISDISNQIIVGTSVTSNAPTITGTYTAGSSKTVNGTSDEPAGTVITLSKTVSSVTTTLGTATVDAFGNWSVSGLTLATGDVLTATAKASGELTSAASNSVTVAAGVPTAPTISTTPIIANQTATISGTGGLGTVTLYLDGSPWRTTTGSSWSTTGYAVSDLSRGSVVTATNTVSGVESAASNSVTVTGVVSFEITGAPSSITAGTPFPITITAKDGASGTGNTFTNFNGYVTLTSTSAIGT